ncbi:hypothetical protein [Chitinibacter sp. GC72]|uniref:hypothetical protein n=1 Tax=Chitinibacter sp. GC72 TaxID=1526917 RepID=UPI0012FA933E|nr:hypothetical protein [Chitinibacter sp. GC72]
MMENSWFDLYRSVIAPTIAIVLVVIGWLLVSRDNNRRELRKELRGISSEIGKLGEVLSEKCYQYFSSVEDEDKRYQLAFEIKTVLDKIETSFCGMSKINKNFKNEFLVLNLRGAVTNNQFFETANFKRLDARDQIHLNIKLKIKDIETHIDEVILRTYVINGVRDFFSFSN